MLTYQQIIAPAELYLKGAFGDRQIRESKVMKTMTLNKSKALKMLAFGTAALAVAGPAMAVTDGTGDFDGFYSKIEEWVTGSLGKTIGIIGLGVGAVQVLRNAYASAAGFVLIGLLLSLGPTVLTSIMGAVV